MKVLGLVVTYNRLELLKEVLKSLKIQSYRLDEILVVNNGSTDGTTEWLSSQTDIQVINQGNVGGAGGFYTGIQWGVANGFEWIWIMDDDVEAERDCLTHMSAYFSSNKLIMPLKINKQTKQLAEDTCVSYNLSNPFRKRNNSVSLFYHGKSLPAIIRTDDTSFEGLLINRSVVEKIGLPNKDLFIIGDDTEYGLRFRSIIREQPLIVTKALLYRKFQPAPFPNWKYYYLVRNTSYLYRKYASSLIMRNYNIVYCSKEVLKNILKLRFDRASYAIWALRDSYNSKMFNRFLP